MKSCLNSRNALQGVRNDPPRCADDDRRERNNMRKYKITAASKEHFESLIKDYRKAGFMLITLGNRVAELETDEEFVFIEY